MKIQKKHSWYTILMVLMIIGFLLVVTTWTLNLVLRELKDNKAQWDYLKAFAWAEGALELALLDIKKNWYWYYKKVVFGDLESKILRDNPNDKKEILISYDLNSKTKTYSGTLEPFKQAVIPLFYIDDLGEHKIDNLKLQIINSFPDSSLMAYNIVSLNWDWLWWKGEINGDILLKWRDFRWNYLEKNLYDFLQTYDYNYLIVINLNENNNLEFNLSSTQDFTKPVSDIISSAQIMNYKQNLKTALDNTEFLWILKYSLYSQ